MRTHENIPDPMLTQAPTRTNPHPRSRKQILAHHPRRPAPQKPTPRHIPARPRKTKSAIENKTGMPQKSGQRLAWKPGIRRVQEVIPVKRRSPYSLVDVKAVSVESIVQVRAGQPCSVGTDVAKREAVVCLYWPDQTFDRPWRVRLPGEVGVMTQKLLELKARCPLVLAMESSGTYGDVLRQAAADAGIEVRRVSGIAVKGHAEAFDGVPSQHDGKDAAVIAELSAQGKSAIWAWQPGGGGGAGDSEQDQAMRYWVRRLDRQQRIKQMYCGQLEALLGRHWPEAQRVLKPASGTLSRTLARWATPQALAADPAAAQALANIGGRWLKPGKIAALLEAARHTVGVRMTDWTAREMREVAQAIVDLRRQIAAARRALRTLAADCPTIQAQAAAVGLATACVLHVCLGDVRNYPHAGAYRKAMGLNLTEHSSGRYKGKLRISKRGQRLCRKWIYFSALRLMQKSAGVKRWVAGKKQRDGGKAKRAVIGVMRRLALAAYQVGANGVAFDAERLFAGPSR
jgi:transposase